MHAPSAAHRWRITAFRLIRPTWNRGDGFFTGLNPFSCAVRKTKMFTVRFSMKPIVIAPIKNSRKAYAVRRMNEAARRMLYAKTVAEEIMAGHWVLAWAVAAGARPSARSVREADAAIPMLVEFRLH
jgi:hypothetical protein